VGLTDAILRLHRDPAMRAVRAARAKELGTSLLPSWDERIGREIAKLEGLAASTRH
jgi:hypothetical protein